MMASNPAIFAGYIAIRLIATLVVWFLIALISVLLCCFCFLPFIPVIGQVPTLPLRAWLRMYPVFFLEQFGPDWEVFDRGEVNAAAGPAAPEMPPVIA